MRKKTLIQNYTSVRRQDLYDSVSERDSTPEEEDGKIRAELNARLASLLSLDLQAAAGLEGEEEEDEFDGERQVDQWSPPDEAEFEFRLFSTSAPSQRVVLATGNDEEHKGPAISSRPISFYLRGELSAEEKARFQFAAVTGAEVLAEAKKRAWGLEVPWRVTKIVVSTNYKREPKFQAATESLKTQGRKRPGKKKRIALRIKEKARKEALTAVEKQKMTKEEHLREKKKRLNRERKLKRRQKEKEKKLAAKGGGGGDGKAASEASSGSE